MIKFFRYVSGFHVIRVQSADIARFLSDCALKNIHIWNIKRKDDITIFFCCYCSQLDVLNLILNKSYSNYEILSTNHLKNDIFKVLKKKAFVSGFLVFVTSIILMSCFIWNVNISGNETVSDEDILVYLEKSGFKKGMFKYKIDPKEIQKNFMLNFDKLSWIWIDIDGTTANISVKERVPLPKMKGNNNFCNCVASRDGVITEIMPRTGKQIAHVGDVVKKGDILIGGISETKSSNIRYMHADGIIMARTWHEKTGVYNHTRTDRYLTGNKYNRYILNVGNFEIPLSYKDKIMYKKYDFEEKNKKIMLFSKIYLPLSFTIQTYYEIIEKDVIISDDEVISSAEKVLKEQLEKDLKDIKGLTIIQIQTEHQTLSDGNILVKAVYECSENIAQHQPIQIPYNTEES